jgi:hypothetical protein
MIAYLRGATIPDETLEAMAEPESNEGHKFSGTTEQLFTELIED